MMDDSDAVAVARAQAGDQDAFGMLVERHSIRLFQLVYRMTGNEQDAEDVVQETFLRAYKQLNRFESRAGFGTWLHRIAANCSLDLLRKRKRQDQQVDPVELESEEPLPPLSSNAPAPDDQVFRLEVQQKGGNRADGALYWKAYAQNKLSQQAEALTTLAELKKSFPDSRWLKDARALEEEIRRAGRQPPDDPGSQTDEELKLLAINNLIQTDPEKAVPILLKLLEGNASPRIKEKALFVLSQSKSDKAREIVVNFARGKSNPELQLKSLEYLALFGGKESRQVLADVYASSTEKKIKKSILGFFMIGGERDRLLAAAKGEKDADLRGEAIGQLGVLGARAELFEMYQAESEVKVKKKILDALFVGGAADKISDLAQNEKDAGLRRAAIEKLGLMGSEGTTATLLKMYANEKEKEIRKKVIEALFLQGNAKAIVEIARKETDPELKKKAVEQLSIMNSKEGTEFFEEILNK